MTATLETHVLGYAGAILFVVGVIACIALIALDPKSSVRVRFAEDEAKLDAEVRFQLWKTSGKQIARGQLIGVAALPLVSLLLDDWFFLVLALPIAVLPSIYMQSKHEERVRHLEAMLDSWLLMLANALKASPSLGEALASSAKLMRPPFGEELDLVLKEMKLGTPLDQAMLNMSTRIKSRVISSSLATVLVGRQTGGDLPKILEQSAATLREMARLEGVVRTKTAEGKMQAIVLASIPFALLAMIHYVDNNWLVPLFNTVTGNIIVVVATALWAAAIFLARKILAVDI